MVAMEAEVGAVGGHSAAGGGSPGAEHGSPRCVPSRGGGDPGASLGEPRPPRPVAVRCPGGRCRSQPQSGAAPVPRLPPSPAVSRGWRPPWRPWG